MCIYIYIYIQYSILTSKNNNPTVNSIKCISFPMTTTESVDNYRFIANQSQRTKAADFGKKGCSIYIYIYIYINQYITK